MTVATWEVTTIVSILLSKECITDSTLTSLRTKNITRFDRCVEMNDFMDLLQYIEESHTFKEAVFSYSDKEDKKAEFTNFMALPNDSLDATLVRYDTLLSEMRIVQARLAEDPITRNLKFLKIIRNQPENRGTAARHSPCNNWRTSTATPTGTPRKTWSLTPSRTTHSPSSRTTVPTTTPPHITPTAAAPTPARLPPHIRVGL